MKRIIQALLLVAVAAVCVFAQQPKPPATVTDAEFQKVLVAVSNEDWDPAVELSAKFLKQMAPEDERVPRLRYIYLYAAAGKVSEGRMEFAELAQLAKGLIGKLVVLPFRPIALECRGDFNFICPQSDGSKDKVMVAATNKTGTTILAFEYVQLKAPFDLTAHDDEPASISGNIQAIVPNPNKSRFLVMRFFISDAIIELKNTPPKKLISANVPRP